MLAALSEMDGQMAGAPVNEIGQDKKIFQH